MRRYIALSILVISLASNTMAASPGNRLTHLDAFLDPYSVGLETAKLTTPQWVGEDEVQAVIVLAIDDMSEPARYETFLRPILNRLKQIDGHAGLSIMTKEVTPTDAQLQSWLKEGVHIEAHTITHPCPCLQKGSLDAAKSTYDRCVDLLNTIPGNRPIAFRMPCCDSMNSVSPRFFAEVINKRTPAGNFLTIDTSIFQLFTPADSTLPRRIVYDTNRQERFRKYIPTDRMMVNYVENYPYPFVVGKLCWEFPCLMPSDWDAQDLNGKCSPTTVQDLKAAIDATVLKQGVFSLCFHPHGWIRNDQVVQLIDHAVRHYGGKVKFLSFRDVERRINRHLLVGQPLRNARGGDNGVRICDINEDGYMDVVVSNDEMQLTRIWSAERQLWKTCPFPFTLISAAKASETVAPTGRFGVLGASHQTCVLANTASARGLWLFNNDRWVQQSDGLSGLRESKPVLTTSAGGQDCGVRLRDIDGDGQCELIVGAPIQSAVFRYVDGTWRKLPFTLPDGMTIVNGTAGDAGLRFVDLDDDGDQDIVFSNAERYAVYRFASLTDGWSQVGLAAKRATPVDKNGTGLPMIVRSDGTNNGVWFHFGRMWIQNEFTGGAAPHEVNYRDFRDLIATSK